MGVSDPDNKILDSGPRDSGRGGLLASRSFVAAAVFMVLLVVGAVWLVADRGRGGTTAPPTAAGTDADGTTASAFSPVDPTPAGDPGASVCGMEAGPQVLPSGPLEFQPLQVTSTLSVPVVAGVGPGVTDGITRCFAHSPTGAVVGAVNFMRWFSARDVLPQVVETLVEPSGDKDRMAEQIRLGWDGTTTSPQTIRGYRAEVRGADEVLVTVLTSAGVDDGRLVSWQVPMVWSGGDWKVRAPSNDSWGERAENSTVGFSVWTVR